MKKDILEKLDEFVENWRDHFYHNVDGCEADADDMLKDWERIKRELNLEKDEE